MAANNWAIVIFRWDLVARYSFLPAIDHIEIALEYNGDIIDELNGFPTKTDGSIAAINVGQAISGAFGKSSGFYNQIFNLSEANASSTPLLFLGSKSPRIYTTNVDYQAQVAVPNGQKLDGAPEVVNLSQSDTMARWTAALNAAELINSEKLGYTANPGTGSSNSNSDAATILSVIGLGSFINGSSGTTFSDPFVAKGKGSGINLLNGVSVPGVPSGGFPAPQTPQNHGFVEPGPSSFGFLFNVSPLGSDNVLAQLGTNSLLSPAQPSALYFGESTNDPTLTDLEPVASSAGLLSLKISLTQILEGPATGFGTIDGNSLSQPALLVGLSDDNTLVAGTLSVAEYAPGDNETFYGDTNPPALDSKFGPPSTDSYDLLMGAALDPTTPPQTGTDTFYAESGNNVMIGGQGNNTFVFNYTPLTARTAISFSPYNPSFNIVWGGGGTSTYDITGSGTSQVFIPESFDGMSYTFEVTFNIAVDIVYLQNPTASEIATLNFGSLYQEYFADYPTADLSDLPIEYYTSTPAAHLLIVNPGPNDKIVFDGQTLTTGTLIPSKSDGEFKNVFADGAFDRTDEGGYADVYAADGGSGDNLIIGGATSGLFGLDDPVLGATQNYLDAGDSAGTLAPGNGIDDLQGSDSDVYAIGSDQGSITVDNAIPSGGTVSGTINLSGVALVNADFQAGGLDDNDLVITIPSTDGGIGTTIDVPNELQSDPSDGIIPPIAQVLAGSTTLTYQQVISLLDTGAPGRTAIYGDGDANVFNSNGYATYAQGNGGGDDFIYDAGYGSLEINEVDTNGVFGNTLSFGAGINESSISLTADSLGNIYLTDGTPGDQIKLDGMLTGLSYGVQEIDFNDGTVWSQLTASETPLPLSVTADDGAFVVQYGYLLKSSGNSDEFAIVGGDTITVNGTTDTIDGGGTASVIVTGLAYVTDGGDGGVIATSAAGGDLLVENGGNDTLTAGGNNDTLIAGTGNDEIVVNGYDLVELAAGADTVTVLSGAGYVTAGPEGGTGNLLFFGGSAPSTVTGSAGSETIYAGVGGGIFYGGTAGGNVLVGATDSAPGEALDLIAAGSSNYLQGNNTGDDVLQMGGASNATIVSEFEGDTVDGGSGNSLVLLSAPYGQDTVNLGSGAATVSVTGAGSGLVYADGGSLEFIGGISASTVVGGSGAETVYAGPGGGAFSGGSSGANVLVGATDAAPGQSLTLTAAGSTNYLQGNNDGDDLLQAGAASNATIVSEAGNDTITGGSGSAFILLHGGSGVDYVNLGSGAATVSATGGAQAIVTGGGGTLEFIGGAGATTVLGGSGNETIYAGSGSGYYAAGAGANNVLVGGSGRATLVGSAGTYMQGDTTGSGAADSLVAGAGDEVLAAGSGADTLAGSAGGDDTFSFLNAFAGQTYTITGFHAGDEFYLTSSAVASYASANQTTSGSTTTITLPDATIIIVQGVSSPLPSSVFGHP